LGEPEIARVKPGARLANGCFIESVAIWRERVRRGEIADEARLLSFYVDPATRRIGHTVLTFREGDALKVIDPKRPAKVVSLPGKTAADPVALARAVSGAAVLKARFFSLEKEQRRTEAMAAAG
jgi:hypothetical protein